MIIYSWVCFNNFEQIYLFLGIDGNIFLIFFMALTALLSLLQRKNTSSGLIPILRILVLIALCLYPILVYVAQKPPVQILSLELPLGLFVKTGWTAVLALVAYSLHSKAEPSADKNK